MSDELSASELVPTSGTWNGLLFENERVGRPLSLVWTFSFDFAEVHRDVGAVTPSLTVDWVPMPGATWSSMPGQRAAASTFAEPIEASVYFFAHHRFDAAAVSVIAQDHTRVLVRAEISGDVDASGLEQLSVENWLEFDGIYVQSHHRPESEGAAQALLAGFTSTDGLKGIEQSNNYVFRRVGGGTAPR